MTRTAHELLLVAALLAGAGCATEQVNRTANGNQTNTNNVVNKVEQAAPGRTARLFDNQFVEVMQVELAANQQLPPHTGGRRIIYSLTDYKIKFAQDGREDEKSFQAGDVHYHAGGAHSTTNTGTTPAEFVVFERRGDASQSSEQAAGKTLLDVASGNARELLNNDDFQVLEVNLPPQAKLPLHFGLSRIAYSLAPYTIKFTVEGENAEERSFNKGDVHFHKSGMHSFENTGETPAKFLIVELKRGRA